MLCPLSSPLPPILLIHQIVPSSVFKSQISQCLLSPLLSHPQNLFVLLIVPFLLLTHTETHRCTHGFHSRLWIWMGENMQYLSFSAWFVLLGMMALPSFAPLRMSRLFINDWLKFCRMYVARFLYSFVCWWTARLAPGFSKGKEQRKAWISKCLCGILTWGPSVGSDGGSFFVLWDTSVLISIAATKVYGPPSFS